MSLLTQFTPTAHGLTLTAPTTPGPTELPPDADTNHKVSRDYGVLIEEEGIALRGLFIINPEGELVYSVVHNNNIAAMLMK